MKLFWDGPPQYSPAIGLDIHHGAHEYPDEHVAALKRLGLTVTESAGKGLKLPALKESENG